ncbi:signal transduction histidine kinase [Actinoplanes lutulentus]|uniref:histidine kinase n=1 Tax=Actinoplanes lutulentus TaxID=1287878 RepID=A0A327ZKF7_9ACTN|nr:histidine kinase [Actinoplanes lutulentus]MBB2944042.1 signal transduction histidine kinase [Actinoplanes lutulentus]RAK42725.1 signal transduction histidine kinase [Actinoplanes lutulentus]
MGILRRTVFLLLGGVLLLPYVLAAGLLGQMIADSEPNRAGAIAITLVTVLVAAVPPFLGGTRELEITAARALLGVDLPDHDRTRPPAVETRLRTAIWFALHLLTGGLIGAVALIAIPVALFAFTERIGLTEGALTGLDLGLLDSRDPWWALAGLLLLVVAAGAAAGLGRLAATMAPALLGPSPAQRAAAERDRERRLAERNRLARELHDSVGHALTAMTLQAGAARAVFDADPAFARQALGAIEETGRAAAEELDTVLGVLRDDLSADRRAAPTLTDLDRLLTSSVLAEIGPVDVPAAVSREAFRIVQESLTNAARHGSGPATLRIRQDEELTITVTNPINTPIKTGHGYGISGMRERLRLLGGELSAGPDGDQWRVEATLPIGPA